MSANLKHLILPVSTMKRLEITSGINTIRYTEKRSEPTMITHGIANPTRNRDNSHDSFVGTNSPFEERVA